MKKGASAIVFFCLFTANAVAQTANADTMIYKVFRSLKAKDEAAFLSLFPNYTQLKEVMRQAVASEAAGNTVREKEMDSALNAYLANFTEELYRKDLVKHFSDDFQRVMKQGTEKGLDWKSAVLDKYTYDKKSEDGFPMLSGMLYLKEGNQEYTLTFEEIIWVQKEGGYFGVSLKNLLAKGEVDKANEERINALDTVGIATNDEPITLPPLPPKKAAKSSAPVKASPVKKAPAAKPKSPTKKA